MRIAAGAANNGLKLRAVFDNGVGTAISNVVTLTVNFAPTVTTQPVSQTVNAGQSATLHRHRKRHSHGFHALAAEHRRRSDLERPGATFRARPARR